jgi:hypothetical protein
VIMPDEPADSGRYQKAWDDDDLRDLREDLARLTRRGPTLPKLPEPPRLPEPSEQQSGETAVSEESPPDSA